MDVAAIAGYSYIEEWYNKDKNDDNEWLHKYVTGKSRFKLCDVGTVLGGKETNLYEIEDAGQDCKDMDLYKCVSNCVLDDDCKSLFFYEGPMNSDLKEPRYFCVNMYADLDNALFFPLLDDSFSPTLWTTLKTFQCPQGSCTSSYCNFKNSVDVSACEVQEYLKTIDDKNSISPLMKKTGSKLIFKDHLGTDILSHLRSK